MGIYIIIVQTITIKTWIYILLRGVSVMNKNKQMLLFCLLLAAGILLDIAPIQVPEGIDMVYHFIGFASITISAISTFTAFLGTKALNAFLFFLLGFGGVFAGISEFLQVFTAVRTCSVNDWITNLSGIALIVAIAFLANAKEQKKIELDEERFDLKDIPITL